MKHAFRYLVPLLVVVSVLGGVVPAANTAVAATVTVEDLLKQIASLQALLNQLIAQQQNQSGSTQMITSFDARQVTPGNDHYYKFSWTSKGAEYCTISDNMHEYFSGERHYKPSGSVRKDLGRLSLGTFTLNCYSSSGGHDWAKVTVKINSEEASVKLSVDGSYKDTEAERGGVITLEWESTGALDECALHGSYVRDVYGRTFPTDDYYSNLSPNGEVKLYAEHLNGYNNLEFGIQCRYLTSSDWDAEDSITAWLYDVEQEPEITSFTARQPIPGNDYYYKFEWTSENTEYCNISDKGMGYFSRYYKYPSSGSVQKDLSSLNEGYFTLYCYNSDGDYDTERVHIAYGSVLGVSLSLEDIAKRLQEIQALINQLKAGQN